MIGCRQGGRPGGNRKASIPVSSDAGIDAFSVTTGYRRKAGGNRETSLMNILVVPAN
jgi:hypothetical protein